MVLPQPLTPSAAYVRSARRRPEQLRMKCTNRLDAENSGRVRNVALASGVPRTAAALLGDAVAAADTLATLT